MHLPPDDGEAIAALRSGFQDRRPLNTGQREVLELFVWARQQGIEWLTAQQVAAILKRCYRGARYLVASLSPEYLACHPGGGHGRPDRFGFGGSAATAATAATAASFTHEFCSSASNGSSPPLSPHPSLYPDPRPKALSKSLSGSVDHPGTQDIPWVGTNSARVRTHEARPEAVDTGNGYSPREAFDAAAAADVETDSPDARGPEVECIPPGLDALVMDAIGRECRERDRQAYRLHRSRTDGTFGQLQRAVQRVLSRRAERGTRTRIGGLEYFFDAWAEVAAEDAVDAQLPAEAARPRKPDRVKGGALCRSCRKTWVPDGGSCSCREARP